MARGVLTVFALLMSVGHVLAQAETRIADLIGELQSQGHRIVYSDNLVSDTLTASVSGATIQALRQALENHDLALEDRGSFWVIVRAEPRSQLNDKPVVDAVRPLPLETVIVTGSLYQFPWAGRSSSLRSFTVDEIGNRPALASDPLRVATQLPGVSTLGVSAKPRVRGGVSDELLIMQDGVELLEPFHMADFHSVYSSIDFHTIESLDIYTGGFPSRYGNRMSGVMDIQSRTRDDDHNVDVGLSTFANFINLRGGLPSEDESAFRLSYREGDLSDLAEFIERRSGVPEYRDLSGRVQLPVGEQWLLSGGAVVARDDIAFEDEEESALSRVETQYGWIGARYQPGNGLSALFTLSWLDFSRYNSLVSEEEEEKGGFLDHRQDIERFALRNDWMAATDAGRLEFGWQLDWSRGEYRHQSEIDRGVLADIIEIPRLESRGITETPRGWAGGAYLQWEYALGNSLTLQPSLRVDAQDYYIDRGTTMQWSPRLGLSYDWNESLSTRASVGRFHQPEGLQELQVLDGINRYFAPQHADQLVLAMDWWRPEFSMTAELYYKRYGDQKSRFENVFNPFVLLPTMESDRARLDPSSATVLGLDLSLSMQLSRQLTASLHYSHMDAQDRIDGRDVDRRWSQEHTAYAGLVWRRNSLSLGAAVTWHSGWRTTLLPEFVPFGETIPVASVLNNAELRDYLSVDLSARYSWELPRMRVEAYADISNISDRKNQAGVDFDPIEVEGGYELERDLESLLGRVVSVGVTLSF